MMDKSKKCSRWVLLIGLLLLTGCSTKPLYDQGLILELYPTRFEDSLYIHAFFQFSPPQSAGWERVELQNPTWVALRKTLTPPSDDNTVGWRAKLSVESLVDEFSKQQDTPEILASIASREEADYKTAEGNKLQEFRAYPDSTCPITPCYRYDWLVLRTGKSKAGKEFPIVIEGHSYLFAHPEMSDLRKKDPGFPFFRWVRMTYSQTYPPGSKKQSIEDDVAHVLNSLRFRTGKEIY